MSKITPRIRSTLTVFATATILVAFFTSWKWAGVFVLGWILVANLINLFRSK